jgi:GNAT superfamily N-acetyltransferase
MTIEVRPAALSDEEAFLDLLPQLFDPPSAPWPSYTRDRGARGFRWAVERDGADVLLAFQQEQLVGFASVYVDIESIRFGRRCWLQDLLVDKDRRSEGVGALLLRAAAGWARERGCTHLELSSGASRLDAHRFYEREGMIRSFAFTLHLDG